MNRTGREHSLSQAVGEVILAVVALCLAQGDDWRARAVDGFPAVPPRGRPAAGLVG